MTYKQIQKAMDKALREFEKFSDWAVLADRYETILKKILAEGVRTAKSRHGRGIEGG